MHEVFLERTARADLQRLPREVVERIVRRMQSLAEEPRPAGCRKISGSRDDWRIRIGEYRVIYEVDDALKRVNVMRVKHRREAYR
ncbi:MAG: type II toxin-antitoxin system RelE/ParE family toxin [Armatimonadetes bacterium]|nr:type II toxin-antitoxin system RelE/ParE family toxin [Armatimonadota bacterium]